MSIARSARPILLAALLGVSACAKKAADDGDVKSVASVTTAVAASGVVDETVTGYGAVEFAPGAERTLAAPMEAKVDSVLAGAGARVGRGQTLVALSPSVQSQADAQKAAADAASAKDAYARALRLKAQGLDSNADVETARSASETADASLRAIRLKQAGLRVASPVSGVVETITASPGDLAAGGASLGKVGDISALRLRLGVDPVELKRVQPGQSVTVQALAGGAAVSGRVASVDPREDPQTHQASVIVTPSSAAAFAPGLPVKGTIVVGHASGAGIPRGAVYYDQDQPYVLVVQRGAAHKRNVKLGPTQGDTTEIASGLNPGERVVSAGGSALDDGTAVREAPKPAPSAEDKAG